MSKIMLVEDDNSLREIYEARLIAEGYTVVSAKDGEEALAMALKERPDLIIADVMMPKVSGFDMLDILRSTPETRKTKIIMMTALSQAEDKIRAEKLGADRYMVKSQVTLEDVTREAHAILSELESQAAATVAKVSNQPTAPPQPPIPAPPKPTAATATKSPVPPTPPAPVKPAVTTIPVTAAPDETATDEKLEKATQVLSEPAKEEKAEVEDQVDEFIATNPTLSTSANPKSKLKADTTASDAVNSLTTPPDSTGATKADSSSARSYVSNSNDADSKKPSSSLEHTKRIEPTPPGDEPPKPTLDELMAREGETLGNDAVTPISPVIGPTRK